MTGSATQHIEIAARQAEHYAELARTGGMGSLWEAADASLQELAEAGLAPDEFLPPEDQVGLGFNLPGTARAFYRAYIQVVRKSLCTKEGISAPN